MEHLSREHEKEVSTLLESINGRLMKLKNEADQYQLPANFNASSILIKAKDAMAHNAYLSKRLLTTMIESCDCHMTTTEEYQCKYELVRIYLTLGPLSHAVTLLQSVKQLGSKLTPTEIFRAKLLEGDVINCVGVLTEAQQCYNEALLLVDKKDNPREWLEASIAVNVCLHAQGRLKDAIDGLLESLTYEEPSDEQCLMIGCIHRALGNVYRSANKFHEAEKHLDAAVVIAAKANDIIKMSEWAADLGRVYRSSGLHHKALEWQSTAYEGALERGDVALLGSVCGEIGFTNYSLKQPNHVEAIRYLGIRYILARDVLEDKAGIRWCLNNLGKVYHSMGTHTPAIECFQKSLELVKGTGNLLGEGTAYGNLGSVLRDAGRYEEAVKYHKLYLVNATSRLDIGGEAIMLRELAFDHWLIEDYVSCREYALRGLLLVEQIRSTFKQTDDQLKVANHEKNEARIFNVLQLVLVKLGQYTEALLVSEMSRGRAVFDLIVREQQNCDKFKTLSTDLVDKETMTFNSTAVDKKSTELRQLASVLSSNIIVYSIVEEPVIPVEQRHIDKRKWLYIWVVNESEISFADKVITNSLFDLNLDENYLTSLKRDIGLRKKKASDNRPQTVADKTHNVPKEATPPASTTPTISTTPTELAKPPPVPDAAISSDPYSYLIEPIRNSLSSCSKSIQRLVIMPCKFLHLIPFASLKDNQGRYLVETFVLSYAQSFSILSLLIESVGRIRPEGLQGLSSGSSLQPLIVGNPLMPFEDADELKGAETEAKQIQSIMGGDLLTGADANKVDVTAALTGRPLIHLATHALLGDSVTEHEMVLESDQITRADTTGDYSMKGSIVLAKSSESCTGLLTSSDIQRIDLSSCQLVTLSCCRSARGTISGDGVLGVSRALIVGGAKCIVNTLWAIEDESTVHLMREFYTKYKESYDAPLALREAMLCLISNGFHVNQWSAFNVTGVSYGMI